MAPHSSTHAWKIPWMEEAVGLQSMGLLRVRHDWVTSLSLFTFMHWRRKWQPTPVFLPGESQGRGSLVGCRLWGCTESDTTEVTLQQQQQALILQCFHPVIKMDSELSTGEGTGYPLQYSCASLVAQLVKNPPAMRETWVQSLGWEDPLEKVMATHSSILAWRIPLTIQSKGLQRVRYDSFHHFRTIYSNYFQNLALTKSVTGSLVGCRLWGRTESDMTEVT